MVVKYYTLVLGKDNKVTILEDQYKNEEAAILCRAGDINTECPQPRQTTFEQLLVELATAREVKIVERTEHSLVIEVIPY